MSKKRETPSMRISNEAFGQGIRELLCNAAAVKEAGIPLPEFKPADPADFEKGARDMTKVSNAAYAEYFRQAPKIHKIAEILRDIEKAQRNAPSASP